MPARPLLATAQPGTVTYWKLQGKRPFGAGSIAPARGCWWTPAPETAEPEAPPRVPAAAGSAPPRHRGGGADAALPAARPPAGAAGGVEARLPRVWRLAVRFRLHRPEPQTLGPQSVTECHHIATFSRDLFLGRLICPDLIPVQSETPIKQCGYFPMNSSLPLFIRVKSCNFFCCIAHFFLGFLLAVLLLLVPPPPWTPILFFGVSMYLVTPLNLSILIILLGFVD